MVAIDATSMLMCLFCFLLEFHDGRPFSPSPAPARSGTVIANSVCLCLYGLSYAHRQDGPHVLYIKMTV